MLKEGGGPIIGSADDHILVTKQNFHFDLISVSICEKGIFSQVGIQIQII